MKRMYQTEKELVNIDSIRIESELTDFYGIKSLAEHIVPIALSFYLGSWSDSLGRHHCHHIITNIYNKKFRNS